MNQKCFTTRKNVHQKKETTTYPFINSDRRHSIKKQKKTTSKKIKTTLHEEPNHISLFIPSSAKLQVDNKTMECTVDFDAACKNLKHFSYRQVCHSTSLNLIIHDNIATCKTKHGN
jgi:lysyl-tRNA synthetase class I